MSRDAYLYIRQSTVRQVFENQESTKRQYALRQRAVALGWPIERVVVIDSDLGQSGASANDREGFQRLVAEVGMGRVGIVLGMEVSRLARNSSDWHRLLEISALARTLILDEDGIYDPCDFNDRLLLGLKGTMSEAELRVSAHRGDADRMAVHRRRVPASSPDRSGSPLRSQTVSISTPAIFDTRYPSTGALSKETFLPEYDRMVEVLGTHLSDLTKRVVADALNGDLSEPPEQTQLQMPSILTPNK